MEPIPPREDPWYKAPVGFDKAKPGTILRLRRAPGSLETIFSNSTAIYNILFSTTDTNYEPSWAVSTLFVPQTTDAHALLSFQIPYNTCDLNSSPSQLLYSMTPEFWGEAIITIQQALSEGWYVSLPDHEGPLAAFCDGVVAGHTVLDSIRAALKAGFGMEKGKTRVGLWGFSGGAYAAGWACCLQAHYAPDLTLAGAALGGLPPKLMLLGGLSGTKYAGLIPQMLFGITAQHPAAQEYLVSQLKPTHRDIFLAAQHYGIAQSFMEFAGQNMFEYFTNGIEILQHPLIRDLFARKAQMGYHGVPIAPLYVYKSIADETTSIQDMDELVETWRHLAVNVLYERNTVGRHLEEAQNGKPRALAWLRGVLDGEYSHEGCTVRDVTVQVDAVE